MNRKTECLFPAALLVLSVFLFTHGVLYAETSMRQRFNPTPEARDEKNTHTGSQEKTEKEIRQEKALSELQQQQKILEQYKPLIQKRTYTDLVKVTESAPDLILNRLPELNEVIMPGRAPNIRLTPYLLTSFAHPAYRARLKGVEYYIAVNCDQAGSFDDCSTMAHNQFANKAVYVRFLQTSDPAFGGVTGMRVGNNFASVRHLFAKDARLHGDGECIQTAQRWLACFDATRLVVDKQRLQMLPPGDAKLLRFIKVSGRGY